MLAIASLHTTTAVTVNEYELRLVEDLRLWLSRQAPASDMYLHNDIDQRFPPGVDPTGVSSTAALSALGNRSPTHPCFELQPRDTRMSARTQHPNICYRVHL